MGQDQGYQNKRKIGEKLSGEAYDYAIRTAGKLKTSSGKVSKTFINQYNQKLAQLMNERVGNITSPSGKVLRFVAKRGDIGVFTALADVDANLDQFARGIHATGRIAYKKETVRKI